MTCSHSNSKVEFHCITVRNVRWERSSWPSPRPPPGSSPSCPAVQVSCLPCCFSNAGNMSLSRAFALAPLSIVGVLLSPGFSFPTAEIELLVHCLCPYLLFCFMARIIYPFVYQPPPPNKLQALWDRLWVLFTVVFVFSEYKYLLNNNWDSLRTILQILKFLLKPKALLLIGAERALATRKC